MKFIKRTMLCMLLSTSALSSYSTSANTAWCSGKVKNVQITTTNALIASFEGVGTYPLSINDASICNLSQEYCKNIYSSLLVAFTTDKSVTFWFKNASAPRTCPSAQYSDFRKFGQYNFMVAR
ncbi:hypothetical protein [Pseudoalteromonas luteoviolacea]|uniref:Uncharacterized protein n=1 Tax=Pseudoalteromonas luteoviolacea S4054 TaxID=1129367 RepID=A0A0F6A8B9_9GAMM|nr:hypothetical protein [Pseudoalteromonas luteoviolacea]AOT07662.1 hypothetical protein S4054249_07310 [Pseudoalteromonas luteoviolacea]AOT12578.1 hypothetical protein S40542_07310 [Pseudoalteromonas luteoviolacea]AOT17492.1 hypothetical protein S4054_07310 [Pseudoalteromonas luteoviolacea]KKE82410.1 hypothetical protein N479_18525 [Pseudoalteromonas luteoviolacea S4054]KZN66325.1 hypothetical protein N481_24325 [Pseudoalteromonas luteoviolacea S4047-1]